MSGDNIDRCPTGITGFDSLCQGGLVRNSDNVLIGGPGTGKTTFLLQFLWNGATSLNENGLYCSFEPDILDTLKDAMALGWDFQRLNEQEKVKFLKFSPQTDVQELKKELSNLISRHNIKRICFDPISVLALHLSDEGKIREAIFELSSLMKRLNVTTIFSDENLENLNYHNSTKKTDIIKFLSDSIIEFYESGIQGVSDRTIRIAKMRRTAHIRRPVGMSITNSGIQVFNNLPQAK